MKQVKRLTATLLAVMVAMSIMPAMVFADGTEMASAEKGGAAYEGPADEAVRSDGDEDPFMESVTDDAIDEDAAYDENAVYDEDSAYDEDPATGEDASFDEDPATETEEYGYSEASGGAGVDAEGLEGADPESQMEEFLFSEQENDEGMTPERPLSVKGDRLSGNDLKYYNRYKSIIQSVSDGGKTNAYVKVNVQAFLGKRTFTASQLGVKKIGYRKNGRWQVTAAAQKKIKVLFDPGNWKKVYTSVLSDYSDESYWVDWYAKYVFYDWYCDYSFNAKSLTFSKNSSITFSIPVMPEFAKLNGSGKAYVYKADQGKLKAAETAKNNAKYIVSDVDSEMSTTFKDHSSAGRDVNRLWRYCQWITVFTDYDHEAAVYQDIERTSPWSFISVLDNDEDTKAVCAGYARAFKYLCDLSDFESDWIDCQIVSGYAGEGHMWNLVRMNDGSNYVVDPTWMDDGDNWDSADESYFLKGDPYGTADAYTIGTVRRSYDDWTKATFPEEERMISANSSYPWSETDREISLKAPGIKNPVKGKKKITVKWKKASPLGALLVDGYQIRYSTRKSMSGAKTVTVKGYNKSSRIIKKLKSKKYYYVQVRAYAKLGKTSYYSPWSAKKKVKTK